MITLEKIIASNLEMLRSQETELLKTLSLVQKAKKLFQSQNGKSKGRPKGSPNVKEKAAAPVKAASVKPKAASQKSKSVSEKPKSVRALTPGSHLFNIVN